MAFGYIGVGFTKLCNHLVAAEEDGEGSALSVFFELLAGDIYDYVLEVIDMNDLAINIILTGHWLQVILDDEVISGFADLFECFTTLKIFISFCESSQDGKGILGLVFI